MYFIRTTTSPYPFTRGYSDLAYLKDQGKFHVHRFHELHNTILCRVLDSYLLPKLLEQTSLYCIWTVGCLLKRATFSFINKKISPYYISLAKLGG